MCLDRITKVYAKPLRSTFTGYKIVSTVWVGKGERFTNTFVSTKTRRKPDVWLRSGRRIKLQANAYAYVDYEPRPVYYPAGFHVFRTYREAKLYLDTNYQKRATVNMPSVVEIRYRQVLADGEQDGYNVRVVGEMKVLSRPRDKRCYPLSVGPRMNSPAGRRSSASKR